MFESREKVYLITDYFDGIRAGFADYQGRPHYFQETFDEENDSYTGEFLVKEVDEEIKELVIEADEIQRRYWSAYRRGKIKGDQRHRVLTEDLERYLEIEMILDKSMHVQDQGSVRIKASFHRRDIAKDSACLEVEWIELNSVEE